MIDERISLLNDLSEWCMGQARVEPNVGIRTGFLDISLQTHTLSCLVATIQKPGDLGFVQAKGRLLVSKMSPELLAIQGRLVKMKSDPAFKRALDEALRVFKESKRR